MTKKILSLLIALLMLLSVAVSASTVAGNGSASGVNGGGIAGSGNSGTSSAPSTGTTSALTMSEPAVSRVNGNAYQVEVDIENLTEDAILRIALYKGNQLTGFINRTVCADTAASGTVAAAPTTFQLNAAESDKAKVFLFDKASPLSVLCSGEKDLTEALDLMLTLSGANISGGTYKNVTVSSAVGDGEVYLNNVEIEGDLNIYGGGNNSIELFGCKVDGKILMAKEPGGTPPRLYLSNTPVSKIDVSRDALIEAADAASAIEEIDTVVDVHVQGASTVVNKINVLENSSRTVSVGGTATINEVVAKAPIMVMSETIKKVEIPEDVTQKISVNVMVNANVEIAVNNSNGADITAATPGANVTVSTELEEAPEVTIGGEKIEHIHKWDDGTVTKEPTYAEEGSKVFNCACGESKTESIPKLVGKDFYKFVENYNGSPLRISWEPSSLITDGKYYLRFNGSSQTSIGTSKTVTGLAPALMEEALPVVLSLQIYSGNNFSDYVPLYPAADIANVTVTAEVPQFTIEKDASGNYNFVSNMKGGMWLYSIYDENGLYYQDNDVNGAISPYAPQKLADGDIIKARYLTWTLNEDKTFANFTVTSIGEYTYTEEATNPGYYFTYNQYGLFVNWPEYNLADDEEYYVTVTNKNNDMSSGQYPALIIAPMLVGKTQNEKTSITVHKGTDFGSYSPIYNEYEIATLTVSGETPDYTVSKDADGNLGFGFDFSLGMLIYSVSSGYSGGTTNGSTNAALEDGYTVTAQLMTWTLNADNTYADINITMPKSVTYNEPDEDEETTILFRKWKTDIMFDGYDDVDDTKSLEVNGIKVVSGKAETMSEFLFDYDQTKGNIIDADFVVELDSVEKDRICGNVDVTISNDEVPFSVNSDGTLSFDETANGCYAYKTTKGGAGRIAFTNGTLVDGWVLPTLSIGETIDIMHIDCTYDETTKAISATLSKHTTKTYSENTSSSKITLTQNGGEVYASWQSTGAPNYYFKIVDADGKYITSGWSNGDEPKTPVSLETYIPKPDQNASYAFVVYDVDASWNIGDEIGRLENCFDITISGTKVEYDIAFNAEKDGEHKITLTGDTLPAGLKLIDCWYDAAGTLKSNGSSTIQTNSTDIQAIQNGWFYDLRVLTTFTLEGQSIKAVMTPPSKTTFIDEDEPQIKWNAGGTVSWQAVAGADDYQVNIYKGSKVDAANIVASKNVGTYNTFCQISSQFDVAALANYENATFTVEVLALDASDTAIKTYVLEDGIDLAFTYPAPTFTYEVTGEKAYTITFPEGTPSGMKYIEWFDSENNLTDGKVGFSGKLSNSYERSRAFQSGDKIKVHIVTVDTTTDEVWTVTMTPPAYQTYGAEEKNIWLEMDGDDLNLVFEDEEGLETDQWYYYYQNGTMLTSDLVNYIDITWYLKNITESTLCSFEVKKGVYNSQESVATLENAVDVVINSNIPNVSVSPQADGSYKLSSSNNTGYFYTVKNPDGTSITSGFTSDGTLLCGLYEGCSIDVRECSITVADDALSADVIMSASVTLSDITLATSSTEEVEVSNLMALQSTIDAGKVAVLTADISSDSRIYFKTGAPATIKLNGHTITAPTLMAGSGKTLTVDGTVAGSAVANTFNANAYSNVTLLGGSYGNVIIAKARRFYADGITASTSTANRTLQGNWCSDITIKNSSFEHIGALQYQIAISMDDCKNITLENVDVSSAGVYSYGADISRCENTVITGGAYNSAQYPGLRIVDGSATITNAKVGSGGDRSAFLAQDGAQVIISGGTYATPSSSIIGLSNDATRVTINGGSFCSTSTYATKHVSYMNDSSDLLTINGGTFSGVTGLCSYPERAKVCGGTFSFDPTSVINSATHTVTANSDGTYTVSEKPATTITDLRIAPYVSTIYSLQWNGEAPTGPNGNYYKVYGTSDSGTTWQLIEYAYFETKLPLSSQSATNYNGIKVEYIKDGAVAETITDLTFNIKSEVIASSTVPAATFTEPDANGQSAVSVTGLTPNTYFRFVVDGKVAGISTKSFVSTSSTSGGAERTLSLSPAEIQNGIYTVYEFINPTLSDDGKNFSYAAAESAWQSIAN